MKQRLQFGGTFGTTLIVAALLSVLLTGRGWQEEPIIDHTFNDNRTTLEVWTKWGYYTPSCWDTRLRTQRTASAINLTFESRKTSGTCTWEGCRKGLAADAPPCPSERVVFDEPIPEFVEIMYGDS